MADNFNTYIEHIEPEFWRELCVKEGKLRHFEKGEAFVCVGHVARYFGYIKSGTIKSVSHKVTIAFAAALTFLVRYALNQLEVQSQE